MLDGRVSSEWIILSCFEGWQLMVESDSIQLWNIRFADYIWEPRIFSLYTGCVIPNRRCYEWSSQIYISVLVAVNCQEWLLIICASSAQVWLLDFHTIFWATSAKAVVVTRILHHAVFIRFSFIRKTSSSLIHSCGYSRLIHSTRNSELMLYWIPWNKQTTLI